MIANYQHLFELRNRSEAPPRQIRRLQSSTLVRIVETSWTMKWWEFLTAYRVVISPSEFELIRAELETNGKATVDGTGPSTFTLLLEQ